MILKFIIVLILIISFLFITFIIKNKDYLLLKVNKLNKKTKNIIKVFLYIIILFALAIILYKQSVSLKGQIEMYAKVNEINEMFDEASQKIDEEISYYDEIISKTYDYNKSKNPYIPEGFVYCEGQWNTGYVIEDDKANQYVWVPCSNVEIDEIMKIERTDFDKDKNTTIRECYDKEYKDFLNSALENGGFYISRYEMGLEDNKLISRSNEEVYCNITRDEAENLSKNMYTSVNSSLINSFAYDTTLRWLEKTGEISAEKTIVKKDEKLVSGRKQFNNIFDFTDNHLEYTLETCYDTVVIRGFSYENSTEDISRYTIRMQDTDLDDYSKVVIRTILYL